MFFWLSLFFTGFFVLGLLFFIQFLSLYYSSSPEDSTAAQDKIDHINSNTSTEVADNFSDDEKAIDEQQLDKDISLARKQYEQAILLDNSHDTAGAEKILHEAVIVATEEGDQSTLSDIRFFLADINKKSGDMTLACENWQLARDLYEKIGDQKKVADVEKMMREAGCPTDWVLNEF